MPLCPQCRSSYLEGEHICRQCGFRLSEGRGDKRYCPQCGTAVGREQNFCHECDTPLKAGLEFTAPGGLEPPPAPLAGSAPPLRPPWLKWAVVAGGAIVVILVLVVVAQMMRKPSLPPSLTPPATPRPLETVPPSPPAVAPQESDKLGEAAPGATPPATPEAAGLPAQLEQVMGNLRDANLKKDLVLYMSCFSYVFPQTDKKRQEIQKTWQNFEFRKMAFIMSKINEVDPNEAVADVAWNMTVQNRSTKDSDITTIKYRVWFAKELGQWKIKKLEELSD